MNNENIIKLLKSENQLDIKLALEVLFNRELPYEALDFLQSNDIRLNPRAPGTVLFKVGKSQTLVILYYGGLASIVEKYCPSYNIFINNSGYEIL